MEWLKPPVQTECQDKLIHTFLLSLIHNFWFLLLNMYTKQCKFYWREMDLPKLMMNS